MLFDCFMYFNERELLELRVKMLQDFVDGFIITDANLTHKGKPKAFTCVETIKELGLPEEKIQVLHVELPTLEVAPNPWIREQAQRNALSVGMRMLPTDSIFHLSDVDSIPKPSVLVNTADLVKNNPETIYKLSLSMLNGRADLRLMDPSNRNKPLNWEGSVVFEYRQLDKTPSEISGVSRDADIVIGDCDSGWHFSWMGDSERRLTKLESIAEHYIWDTPEVRGICRNFKPEEGSTDMLGRKDHVLAAYPHDLLPPELFKMERVKEYLLPSS